MGPADFRPISEGTNLSYLCLFKKNIFEKLREYFEFHPGPPPTGGGGVPPLLGAWVGGSRSDPPGAPPMLLPMVPAEPPPSRKAYREARVGVCACAHRAGVRRGPPLRGRPPRPRPHRPRGPSPPSPTLLMAWPCSDPTTTPPSPTPLRLCKSGDPPPGPRGGATSLSRPATRLAVCLPSRPLSMTSTP